MRKWERKREWGERVRRDREGEKRDRRRMRKNIKKKE